MENRKKTGMKIRKARKEKKLTLAELADLVGKSENYIGKIERGECTPSIGCYEKICSFLDVDFETNIVSDAQDDDAHAGLQSIIEHMSLLNETNQLIAELQISSLLENLLRVQKTGKKKE